MLSSIHLQALPASTAPEAGTGTLETIGTPLLWGLAIAAVVGLFVFDFVATRRPYDVSMREAVGWSAFYVALPLAFGVYVLTRFGTQTGLEYYTWYIVEKSLSMDNLFVFILIMGAFAAPRHLQQRALLLWEEADPRLGAEDCPARPSAHPGLRRLRGHEVLRPEGRQAVPHALRARGHRAPVHRRGVRRGLRARRLRHHR